MKKIICLLLILACAFAMVSCKKKNKETESGVETISKIVNESLATKIVTKTEYLVEGEETLTGKYTTEIDRSRGNSKFTFEYQRYARIEDMNDDRIKTVKGSVFYNADGNVSYNEGDTWEAADAIAYLPFSLDINESRFVSYEVSEDGNNLKAEIAAGEAKRIFGTDISAEGNITLEIDTNGKYLYEIRILYTAEGSGAKVNIQTSYDYSQVNVKFE